MSALTQDPTLILGSPADIQSLSQKDTATALVISDSHGYTAQLQLALYERGKSCDALFFCGDGISDLCLLLTKAQEQPDFAAYVPPVVCFVEGNCDTEYYNLGSSVLRVPLMQTVSMAGHTVLCTHGHRFSLYNGTAALEEAAERNGADIVLYGHTHVAHRTQQGHVLVANPGSCAKPRSGQPPCYALLEVQKGNPCPAFTVYQISPDGSRPYAV